MSIFVPLAALDDNELIPTIENLFNDATHPDEVFVGLHLIGWPKRKLKKVLAKVKQYGHRVNVQVTDIDVTKLDRLGVGYGRSTAMDMYSGQDYVLQIDSHSYLAKEWDTKLVGLYAKAAKETGLKKFILTGYAGEYRMVDNVRTFPDDGEATIQYPMYNTGRFFANKEIPAWDLMAQEQIPSMDQFVPALKFNANFAFGTGEWAKYSGLERDAIFYDEEIVQTINLLREGFALVFPRYTEPLVCHLYANHKTKKSARQEVYLLFGEDVFKVLKAKEAANYVRMLNDPANKEIIDKYQRWSKVNLRLGPIGYEPYFPLTFITE